MFFVRSDPGLCGLARRLCSGTDASHSSDSSQNATSTSPEVGAAAGGRPWSPPQHQLGPGHRQSRPGQRGGQHTARARHRRRHPAPRTHSPAGVLQCGAAVPLIAHIAGNKMPLLPAAPVNVCPSMEWRLKFQYFS